MIAMALLQEVLNNTSEIEILQSSEGIMQIVWGVDADFEVWELISQLQQENKDWHLCLYE